MKATEKLIDAIIARTKFDTATLDALDMNEGDHSDHHVPLALIREGSLLFMLVLDNPYDGGLLIPQYGRHYTVRPVVVDLAAI